ncbi:MAG TPA: multicopper oxidase domain-containing protein [Terrimicrobiaceae bacterium]|nr:multicopper oxidase domain-containing protein [Terrimicrobiaceae bacterium]
MKSHLTRRDFCKLTAAAAGITILRPATVAVAADDGSRELLHQFAARLVTPESWPDGAVKKGGMILVNDSLPGPTIRARQGDTIVVRVRNDLSEGTTVHWHGMTQLGTWQMDGVANISQEPIPPGETFEYRFKAEPAGTHLWHSHTGVQYGEGMFGMLVVEAADDPYRDDYDVEHTVCINDWFHEPGTQILSNLEKGVYMEPMKMGGSKMGATATGDSYKGPDLGDVPFQSALINGKGRFQNSNSPLEVFAVEPKQRVRFRMANIGTTYEMRVCLDGHRLTVIAADGIPVVPSTVDSVTLDIGERCDVIVEMDQPVGNYWLRAYTLDPRGQDGVRAIVRYAGAPAVEPADAPANWGKELDYNALRSRDDTQVPAPDLAGTHVLGGSMKPYRWTWDGRAFVAPKTSFRTEPNAPDPPVTQFAVKNGQNVRLVLNNPTGMTHPFHIHGRHFQLLYQSSNNAGDYKDGPLNLQAPCEKDTISVHAGGHAVIQWKESNPGFWFFHCHIEWHLATGMAVVIRST